MWSIHRLCISFTLFNKDIPKTNINMKNGQRLHRPLSFLMLSIVGSLVMTTPGVQCSGKVLPTCVQINDDEPSLNAQCSDLNYQTIPFILTKSGKNLKVNLMFNRIARLEDNDFVNKTSLHNRIMGLTLSWCRISVITDGAFNGLSDLDDLNLHGNRLTNVPSAAFRPLVNLKYLYLGGNPIKRITENAFSNVAKLYLLHLNNYDDAVVVEKNALAALSNLKILYMNQNKKLTLTCDSVYGLANLDRINLEDSHFACSCNQCEQKDTWMCLKKVSSEVDGTCS